MQSAAGCEIITSKVDCLGWFSIVSDYRSHLINVMKPPSPQG